jgi:heme exporter protein CcmD
MPGFDKYAPYVFWSYGIAAFILSAIVVWTVSRVRSARKALDEAEALPLDDGDDA